MVVQRVYEATVPLLSRRFCPYGETAPNWCRITRSRKPESYKNAPAWCVSAVNRLLRQPDENPTIRLLIRKSKDQTKVEWAFESIQNPMGVDTYEGIKIVDKLPSVQVLQERIKLLKEQLEKQEKKTKKNSIFATRKTT